MLSFTFSTAERLKSRKVIASLFQKDKSQSFGAYPLRLVWIPTEVENDFPVQSSFSVPKKTFRRANQRNTLRRRMREAYRLHKHLIYNNLKDSEKKYALMWLFTGKEEVPYQDIEKSMIFAIHRFLREIKKEKPVH
jgi:ribonuclease P protein component